MQIGTEQKIGMQTIHPKFDYLQAEVIWQARYEMARTVADVLARRTRFLLKDAKASMESAPVVAKMLAQELNKNKHWQQEQIEQYRRLAAQYGYPDK